MARVSVDVLFRSPDSVEVEPGVYDYTWIKTPKPLPARVLSSGYSVEDNQSVNQNWMQNTRLEVILSNDATDRLNRISYVKYLGKLYEARTSAINRPKVVITLGDTSNRTIEDLLAIKAMEVEDE